MSSYPHLSLIASGAILISISLLAFTFPVGVIKLKNPASAITFKYRHYNSPFGCFVTVFYHVKKIVSRILEEVDNKNNWWNI